MMMGRSIQPASLSILTGSNWFSNYCFFVVLSVTVKPPNDPVELVILTSRKRARVIIQCAGHIPDILKNIWKQHD